jgi:hypothetical protein
MVREQNISEELKKTIKKLKSKVKEYEDFFEV